MSNVRLLGIDFSGSATQWRRRCAKSSVWIASADLSDSGVKLYDLVPVQALPGDDVPFERLQKLLLNTRNGFAAIDAPFSVPAEFAPNAQDLWRMLGNLPRGERPFAHGSDLIEGIAPDLGPRGAKRMRHTEQYWARRKINVRSTMWNGPRGGAPFAIACMTGRLIPTVRHG